MNSPLEQYLDTLHRYLRFVPSGWRDEQIVEVREHLIAHVDELTLAGMTPHAAEEEAIRCFGRASQTARSLIIAWWRQLLPLDGHTRQTTFLVTLCFLLTGMQYIFGSPLGHLVSRATATTKTYYDFGQSGGEVLQYLALLSTFLFGVLAGALRGKRAVVGVLWGAVVARGVLYLYFSIDFTLRMQDPQFRHMTEDLMARVARHDPSITVIPTYVSWVQWLPHLAVLCLGAYLGKRRHQRQRIVA